MSLFGSLPGMYQESEETENAPVPVQNAPIQKAAKMGITSLKSAVPSAIPSMVQGQAQQQKKAKQAVPTKGLTKKTAATTKQPAPAPQGLSPQQVSAVLSSTLPGVAGALSMKGSQSPAQIAAISGVLFKPLINSLDQINANLGTLAAVAEPLTTWLNTQNGKEGQEAKEGQEGQEGQEGEEEQEGGRRRRRGRRSTRRSTRRGTRRRR